jgi:hypothetical protein
MNDTYASGYQQAMADIADILNAAHQDGAVVAIELVANWVSANGGKLTAPIAAPIETMASELHSQDLPWLPTKDAPVTSVRLANGVQVWVNESDLPPVRGDFPSAEHWQSCPAHGKDVQPAAGPREWAPLQAGDTVLARWDVALGQWTPAAWLNEANAEQYTVVKLSPAGADGMLVRKFLRGQSGPRVWITQGQYIRRPADALADTDDHLCTEDCANQPGHNL